MNWKVLALSVGIIAVLLLFFKLCFMFPSVAMILCLIVLAVVLICGMYVIVEAILEG